MLKSQDVIKSKETFIVLQKELVHQLKWSRQISDVIESIIYRKLIQKKSEEFGITVEDCELQRAADSFRSKNNLISSNATWSWLKKHYMSIDDFEQLIYYIVLSEKLSQHLFAQRVNTFFAEHQLDYIQAVLYEIILDDVKLSMELYYALQENEISFPEIARQYIQDPESRYCWGYKGKLYRNDLKPEISAAVFAARPPQVLKPIITFKKAHLILVEEIIQPTLNDSLRAQILEKLFLNWLSQQLEEVEVSIEINSSTA